MKSEQVSADECMEFRWQLALYDNAGETLTPLQTLLQTDKNLINQLIFEPECSILFNVDGEERIGLNWNLGDLNLIILQFEAACARLSNGKDAIIRSGFLGSQSPPYLLLEPCPSAKVNVSHFCTLETSVSANFPIDGILGRSKILYDYLSSYKEKLFNGSDFVRLPCPELELLKGLKREALLGRQLYQLAERPI